ncbi:MAG TPA: helix-hairpin-helix domain-containing protein [Polyangiaceae bacterium]|jgi:competence protein ComEA|nr:helix-hairpin-helix domain-containing protein [Polyangiaceae bacterium]
MDARDFEPVVDRASPSAEPVVRAPAPVSETRFGEGRSAALAVPAGFLERARLRISHGVWAPVALRATAIGLGMLGLAAIGAWSTLAGAGTAVPTASSAVAAPQKTTTPVAGSATTVSPTAGAAGATSNSPSVVGSGLGEQNPASGAPTSGITADGKVILNVASAEELTKLPRVGPKRAQAIVDLRKRLGKFRQPTDLLRVRGIGRKTLRQLMPSLVLDAPAAPPR